MIRNDSQHRGMRVLLAAMIASAVVAVIPAQAAGEQAPVPGTSTAPHGWSNSLTFVGQTYSFPPGGFLDVNASSVSVTDRDGLPVSGWSGFSPEGDALIFHTSPGSEFSSSRASYEAIFTARANNQDPAFADVVTTVTFSIDNIVPFAPNVVLNDGTSQVVVSTSGDVLEVNGLAEDDEFGSGVKTVTIHFYNPVSNLTAVSQSGIPQVRQEEIDVACSPGCPTSYTIQHDLSGLETGYWNIKVSVTDAAGNRSSESDPLVVLRIAE